MGVWTWRSSRRAVSVTRRLSARYRCTMDWYSGVGWLGLAVFFFSFSFSFLSFRLSSDSHATRYVNWFTFTFTILVGSLVDRLGVSKRRWPSGKYQDMPSDYRVSLSSPHRTVRPSSCPSIHPNVSPPAWSECHASPASVLPPRFVLLPLPCLSLPSLTNPTDLVRL